MHVAFNQDVSCVVTGTEHGFRVYNCAPFGKFYTSDAQSGLNGVGLARMLFSTSLVALVGNGELNSPRKLTIVNTRRPPPQTPICELTFPTSVRNLLLNRQRLVVVLDAQIYIYNIANMKLLFTLNTVINKLGVSSITPRVDTPEPSANPDGLSSSSEFPSRRAGEHALVSSETSRSEVPDATETREEEVSSTIDAESAGVNSPSHPELSRKSAAQLKTSNTGSPPPSLRATNNWLVYPAPPRTKHHLAPPKHASDAPKAPQGDVVVFDMNTLAPVTVINAHRSPIAYLALNEDGTLLATTSDKGTLIRVFAVPSGTLLYEFRRGSYQSTVYSIAFSLGSTLLCVSSATQTVHIYQLDEAHRVKSPTAPAPVQTEPSLLDELGNLQVSKKPKKPWFPRSAWPAAGSKSAVPRRDFASFKLPLKPTVRTIVGMPPLSNTVYVATESGKLFHYALDRESGGECSRIAEHSLD